MEMKRFFEIVIVGTTIAVAGCGSGNSSGPTPLPVQQDPNNPYYQNNCYQGFNGDSVMVVRNNPITGQREFGYIPRSLYTEEYARRVAAGDTSLVFCPVTYGDTYGNGGFDTFVGDHYYCGHRRNGYAFYIVTGTSAPWWGYQHYSWHSHSHGHSHNHWWKVKFRWW